MNRLRKVLDMEERQQYDWLWKHQDEFGFDLKWIDLVSDTAVHELIQMHLADLAFRLRDEAGARFYTAMRMMYDELTNDSNPDGFDTWWMFTKPIHWIIAALAKGDKL